MSALSNCLAVWAAIIRVPPTAAAAGGGSGAASGFPPPFFSAGFGSASDGRFGSDTSDCFASTHRFTSTFSSSSTRRAVPGFTDDFFGASPGLSGGGSGSR